MTFPTKRSQPRFDHDAHQVYCASYLWLIFNGAPADLIKAAAKDVLHSALQFGEPLRETVH